MTLHDDEYPVNVERISTYASLATQVSLKKRRERLEAWDARFDATSKVCGAIAVLIAFALIYYAGWRVG